MAELFPNLEQCGMGSIQGQSATLGHIFLSMITNWNHQLAIPFGSLYVYSFVLGPCAIINYCAISHPVEPCQPRLLSLVTARLLPIHWTKIEIEMLNMRPVFSLSFQLSHMIYLLLLILNLKFLIFLQQLA